jgi:hypothetical protein
MVEQPVTVSTKAATGKVSSMFKRLIWVWILAGTIGFNFTMPEATQIFGFVKFDFPNNSVLLFRTYEITKVVWKNSFRRQMTGDEGVPDSTSGIFDRESGV